MTPLGPSAAGGWNCFASVRDNAGAGAAGARPVQSKRKVAGFSTISLSGLVPQRETL